MNTNKILNSDQIEHSPPAKKSEKGKVTAVVALAKYDQARHHKSSSDGDLLFHVKGKTKHFPYLTRQVPCSWHMSNGVFQTKGRGKLTIKFFEYSNSLTIKFFEYSNGKKFFEYDKMMGKPAFDLIIGRNSMESLGIVMNFKDKTITIDEINLPMKNIASLTNKSKIKEAWAVSNALAQEPISTELATQHAMKILDANYKRQTSRQLSKITVHTSFPPKKKATRVTQSI